MLYSVYKDDFFDAKGYFFDMKDVYISGSFGFFETDNLTEHPFILGSGGVEHRFNEKYYFDNSKRPNFNGCLIQYTLKGSGKYIKNGITHDISENTGFIINLPEDSIYYLPENASEPWVFVYIHFDGFAVTPYMKRLEELTNGIFSLPVSSSSIRQLLNLQERICSGEKLKKYESGEIILHFLCSFLRDIETSKEETDNNLVKKALSMLEDNHKKIESVQNLAESLHVSEEHLCRLFKSEMNVTPGQQLLHLKIQSAMQDLLNTNDTLEAIAIRNGFSNANYFGKIFKKKVGITPMQYRNRA